MQNLPMDALCAEYPTTAEVDIQKWLNGEVTARRDVVAEEVPIALEYNGISHVVMMASPADLADFALGFSLTEGILADPSELFDCEIVVGADGIQVQLEIAAQRFMALKEKRRNLTGRTGCGLCGAETLAQAIRKVPPVQSSACFSAPTLHTAIERMQQQQQLQQTTGATHAAAWVQKNGDILAVREDVGRHNALDKLIGMLAAARQDFSTGAVLITSRASYEMVQKSAVMGIGLIAAISAPTALAIKLAREAEVTLVGFMRQHSHAVYANGHRLSTK
ncbi:formate dehydrogenase accessory sulfurtransferase FdhD [Glaciimonas immobilis]|uniref:Sulfur carrier protein FdhD n=1 Tax=Glaciimonas immobilis TaxID=728004 RepID=A0A840RVZ3_9BURK|nr:formate dehydrogenase accessory sulfurtransferase FdhD [Glaciimonas immobilis]KAF3997576.1 formate dehydrogenase accessory sulfurtransferase FdhD [Glaciimonas immobilis]MBB5200731.1 FdhD protein [Glaciimonas immobilis]